MAEKSLFSKTQSLLRMSARRPRRRKWRKPCKSLTAVQRRAYSNLSIQSKFTMIQRLYVFSFDVQCLSILCSFWREQFLHPIIGRQLSNDKAEIPMDQNCSLAPKCSQNWGTIFDLINLSESTTQVQAIVNFSSTKRAYQNGDWRVDGRARQYYCPFLTSSSPPELHWHGSGSLRSFYQSSDCPWGAKIDRIISSFAAGWVHVHFFFFFLIFGLDQNL